MLSDKPFEIPSGLLDRAGGRQQKAMAVVGADHPVAMESARQSAEAGLVMPVLVGDERRIREIGDDIEWSLDDVRIVDASDEASAAFNAVELARNGAVDALMKGHVHTDALMRAVVNKDTGLRTGRRLSHIFHMTVPGSDRVLHITDAAINVSPDVSTRIDIARNAVSLCHALGNERPRVAVLSATESPIAAMPSSVEAAEIVRLARAGEIKGAVIDGPFALDNAISPAAAALKGVEGEVAGQADVLVVPNIETGNALFKAMVLMVGGLAAGIVMGAKVPIVLTSRSDPPEARLAASAISVLVADHNS